ncbi:MAG: hypothetical protein R3A50_00920 [Saprospiraceae bacterium]
METNFDISKYETYHLIHYHFGRFESLTRSDGKYRLLRKGGSFSFAETNDLTRFRHGDDFEYKESEIAALVCTACELSGIINEKMKIHSEKAAAYALCLGEQNRLNKTIKTLDVNYRYYEFSETFLANTLIVNHQQYFDFETRAKIYYSSIYCYYPNASNTPPFVKFTGNIQDWHIKDTTSNKVGGRIDSSFLYTFSPLFSPNSEAKIKLNYSILPLCWLVIGMSKILEYLEQRIHTFNQTINDNASIVKSLESKIIDLNSIGMKKIISGYEENLKIESQKSSTLQSEIEDLKRKITRMVGDYAEQAKKIQTEYQAQNNALNNQIALLTKNTIQLNLDKSLLEEQVKSEREKAAQEFHDKIFYEKIFNDDSDSVEYSERNNWERFFYDELANKVEELNRAQVDVTYKEKLLELTQIANDAKLYYSLGDAERKIFEARMIEERSKIEMKIYDDSFDRKNHLLELDKKEFSIEKKGLEQTRKEIELAQTQLFADFTKMSAELKEQSLSLREFAMIKEMDYKKFEITAKENLLKVAEMINLQEAKNLQGEKTKLEVAGKLAEMGIQVREQNVQLQKQMNEIEQKNIRNDRQLLEMNREKIDVQNMLTQGKLDFQKNQNDLMEIMLEIKDGEFKNAASSLLIELNKKHFENDIQLQNIGLVQRENEMTLKGRENDIRSIHLTNQSVVNNLRSLQKENRMLASMDAQRQSHYNEEQNLQSRIWSLQNSLERSQIDLSNERALRKYLNQ